MVTVQRAMGSDEGRTGRGECPKTPGGEESQGHFLEEGLPPLTFERGLGGSRSEATRVRRQASPPLRLPLGGRGQGLSRFTAWRMTAQNMRPRKPLA